MTKAVNHRSFRRWMSVITDTFQSGLSIPLFTFCSKLIGHLPKELHVGHYKRLIAFIIQSLVFCSQRDMRRCLLRRLHGLESLDVFANRVHVSQPQRTLGPRGFCSRNLLWKLTRSCFLRSCLVWHLIPAFVETILMQILLC